MVYGCGNRLIKFSLFIANLLIFIFGGLIFGVSLWANLDKNFGSHLRDFAHEVKIETPFINELSKVNFNIFENIAFVYFFIYEK